MIYHIISSFLRKEEINLSEQKIVISQQQEDGSYLDLFPKTDGYTKDETLTSETSQMFGIDNGTPEQILQYLGKYNQYWWRKEFDYIYTQIRESGSGDLNSNGFADDGRGVLYAYSNQVTYSGTTTEPTAKLVDTAEAGYVSTLMGTASGSWPNNTNVLGKYFQLGMVSSTNRNPIFFIPQNAVLSTRGNSNNRYIRASSYEKITYTRQDRVFEGYVQSNNRNAYPDAGTQGSYYYTFLGVPLSNAVLLAKTGEYL